MKRLLTIFLTTIVLFTGCADSRDGMNGFVAFRDKMLKGNGCSFETTVTVDYGNSFSSFDLVCKTDNVGDMALTVTNPDSISGISCKISGGKGQLTFDDKAVAFEMLANGQITPISAPWLFIKALRGGYISSCSEGEMETIIRIDDSFGDVPFSVDVRVDETFLPKAAEIIWNGKRIVSMEISSFIIV